MAGLWRPVAALVLLVGAQMGGAWEQAPGNGTPLLAEPDLTANSRCNTGNCTGGGYLAYYRMPLENFELGYKSDTVTWEESKKDVVNKTIATAYKVKNPKFKNVLLLEVKTKENCCFHCKYYNDCTFWQFVRVGCGNHSESQCFLYANTSSPKYTGPNQGVAPSVVGAKCHGVVADHDPHMVGAHGTHFDFNGIPNESFCLVTDSQLQINMKMAGYYDNRTQTEDGQAPVRTWIRELGIVWMVGGEEHKLHLVARAGPETTRGFGFLATAELDGSSLPRMQVGEEAVLAGSLLFTVQPSGRSGPYEMDFYKIQISGLLDMEVNLRAAHPQLRTAEEAYVHISLGVDSLKVTSAVHGILGQTYREDHAQRAEHFSLITSELLRPISAESEEGKGFLDGQSVDYVVSHVLETDCLYSAYGGVSHYLNNPFSQGKSLAAKES